MSHLFQESKLTFQKYIFGEYIRIYYMLLETTYKLAMKLKTPVATLKDVVKENCVWCSVLFY